MYIDQDLVVVNVKAAMNDSVNHCACLLWFVVQRLLIGDYGRYFLKIPVAFVHSIACESTGPRKCQSFTINDIRITGYG